MALLSTKIVEEILEVAEAYAARERARLTNLNVANLNAAAAVPAAARPARRTRQRS